MQDVKDLIIFILEYLTGKYIHRGGGGDISKNYFWFRIVRSENEPTLRIHNNNKNLKIIFGSKLSETNNELTFRLHQKNDKI